jgi:hypothetical protein
MKLRYPVIRLIQVHAHPSPGLSGMYDEHDGYTQTGRSYWAVVYLHRGNLASVESRHFGKEAYQQIIRFR